MMFSLYSPPSVYPILLRQKAALSEAFEAMRRGTPDDDVIHMYRVAIVPSLVALHSVGYPIISFYIDHILFTNIDFHTHRYVSLLDSLRHTLNISRIFVQSCLYNRLRPERDYVKNMPCGTGYIYNIKGDEYSVVTQVTIAVPHLFYIQIKFLEVIAVGGLSEDECLNFQSFKIWYATDYPFGPFVSRGNDSNPFFKFCGSHEPFTTVIPGNIVWIESTWKLQNKDTSLKLGFSAVDMLVSQVLDDASLMRMSHLRFHPSILLECDQLTHASKNIQLRNYFTIRRRYHPICKLSRKC